MGLLDALIELSTPLLAAVNGVAVGLGFTVLAHCDLVLVDATARLRVPFAELGVPHEAASSVLFPARMGWQQAARILLTSDWVDAAEAVQLGMALRVCDEGTTLAETVALAARIAAHPHAALRAITSLMRAGHHDLVQAANRREQAAFSTLLGSAVASGPLAGYAPTSPA
jgi:enoyl-CoA hydratase/carnithine racemase